MQKKVLITRVTQEERILPVDAFNYIEGPNIYTTGISLSDKLNEIAQHGIDINGSNNVTNITLFNNTNLLEMFKEAYNLHFTRPLEDISEIIVLMDNEEYEDVSVAIEYKDSETVHFNNHSSITSFERYVYFRLAPYIRLNNTISIKTIYDMIDIEFMKFLLSNDITVVAVTKYDKRKLNVLDGKNHTQYLLTEEDWKYTPVNQSENAIN